ncbi:hypothetical protein [Embleya sp. NPDC005971]|uniref:hypothetical protein n=1 Tax=Embleya sp. NPDC005971 TaxID=3156724 RepID=UPI0033CF343B
MPPTWYWLGPPEEDARPLAAVSLTYTWSDGHTHTIVDRAIPSDPREQAILRALLAHALGLLDADAPVSP